MHSATTILYKARACAKSTQKSVKSVHSSRILRASQSPNKVEKQPKSTPDMYNPPTHCSGEDHKYTYPRGHSLLLSGLYSEKFCEDFKMSQTTSINAFYVTAFFTLPVPAKFVDLSKFAAKVRLFFDICKENRIFFWSLYFATLCLFLLFRQK